MIEGLLAIIVSVVGATLAGSFITTRQRRRSDALKEQHRKELEAEGYVLPKIQECRCSPEMRDTIETDTGKIVCLTCGKRVFQ